MFLAELFLVEKCPPGREEQCRKLKDEFCGGKKDCPRAYATAWASYNKSKKKKS
jgi:hypothetical protein